MGRLIASASDPRAHRSRLLKGNPVNDTNTIDLDEAAVAAFSTRGEAGMTTAEYAVGTVSACGFGGILYKILTSEFGESLLEGLLDTITSVLPF